MVKVELNWNFEATNGYPAVKGIAMIKTTTEDGTEFEREMSVQGDDPGDCVNLLFKNQYFTPLLKALSIAALPEDEIVAESIDNQRDEFYAKLEKDLIGISYGEMRKFVAENGLSTKIRNGSDKGELATKIIKEIQKKELDEKDN
jgi:hypothetical protein